MDRLPEGGILVTIGVVGLYPHIPHNEGLESIRKILNMRNNQAIPTDDIVNLAEFVLRNNNFEFDGKNFLQKRGTAIGTRMAPAYANIFMNDLESRLLDLAPVKPYHWLRYIDDIFVIWTAGKELLLDFLEWINQYHVTIKFTWDWSKKNVKYLMSRLLLIMALLKPICIQSQLISISSYSVPRATQRGVKKHSLCTSP